MSEYIFDPRGYILLSGIELPELPDAIEIDGYNLHKKREFHITLVGAKALEYLCDIPSPVEAMQSAFAEFVKTYDLTQFNIRQEYRLAKYKDRVTVVAMADIEGIDELFAHLNSTFQTNIPTQPTHVTLYSLDPATGIPINSANDLADYTQVVDVPELNVPK